MISDNSLAVVLCSGIISSINRLPPSKKCCIRSYSTASGSDRPFWYAVVSTALTLLTVDVPYRSSRDDCLPRPVATARGTVTDAPCTSNWLGAEKKSLEFACEQCYCIRPFAVFDSRIEKSYFMAEQIAESKPGFKTALVFSMLFAIIAAILVFTYYATFRRPVTTLILVRHAEKIIDPNNTDVDLNADGQARAQELVRMFGDAGINAIYATQYKRTQETVKPLADKTGVPVSIVNSKNTADLLAQLRAQHSGQTIFIAGNNNTVPEIIAALGGPQYPIIPETEYDNLYIVTVYRTGKAKVLKMKYGKQPSAGTQPPPMQMQ